MHIKVKNFKIFREETLFEILPITILAGPNNSGKSTLIKLMKLLKNGVEELKFSKTDYSNSEFKSILNWDSQNDPCVVTIPYEPLLAPFYNRGINLIYRGAVLEKIELISLSNPIEKAEKVKPLLTIRSHGWPHSLEDSFDGSDIYFYVSLDIVELINHFFSKRWYFYNEFCNGDTKFYDVKNSNLDNKEQYNLHDFYRYKNTFLKEESFFKNVPNRQIDPRPFYLGVNRKDKNAYITAGEAYKEARRIEDQKRESIVKEVTEKHLKKENELIDVYRSSIYNEILSLNGRENLYCIFNGEEDVTEQYYDEIIELQTELFNHYNLEFQANFLDNNKGLLGNVTHIIEAFLKDQLDYMVSEIEDFVDYEDIVDYNYRVVPSRLHQLIFTEKYVGKNITHKHTILDTFFNDVILGENFENNIKYNLPKRINYLSPRRGSHQKVLLKIGEHDINNEVNEYVENKNIWGEPKIISDYINTVLSLFNIDGKLLTESFYDSAYALCIEKSDGQKLNIANFGFGISQLIPILLKIANLAYNNRNNQGIVNLEAEILIIEEPESNLHPDFQAKLADFFTTTINLFKGPKLILESHSEYLIRRLQYLVAAKEVKTNDIMINYFNSDESMENGDSKVKHIKIEQNGNLSDSLGTGFLDETTKLQFELLKLNNRKS